MPTDFSGGCEAVDLGLSVKWASYNVGAQNADGRGSYFAWGETDEKDNYDWSYGYRCVGQSVRAVTEH